MNKFEPFIMYTFIAFLVCYGINKTKTMIETKRFQKQKDMGLKPNLKYSDRMLHQIFAIDGTSISLTVFLTWILTYDIKKDYFSVVQTDPVMNWISDLVFNEYGLTLGYSMLTMVLLCLLFCSFWILFKIVPNINRSIMIRNMEIYNPVIRGYNLLTLAPLVVFIYIQTLL